MFKIILILVLTKNIRVYGDDDRFEKFIDLLPEEEKEEFLDRIARRILEDVDNENVNDNNDSNKPDVEINDEQLDAHDVYVKNILREETKRHENDKSKDDPVKNEETGGYNGDESKYIDLTLRDGKALKINGEEELLVTSEIPYNVIPVKTVYDDVNDDPSQTEDTKLEENESTRLKYESENLSNISSNHIKNEDSLRKSFQNDLNSISTSMYFDNSSVTEDYIINKESALPTIEENKTNKNSDLVIKETIYNRQDFDDLNKNVGTESVILATNVATTISSKHSSLYNEEEKYKSSTFMMNDTKIAIQNTLNNTNEKFQRSSNIENISTDVASTTDAKKVNTNNIAKLTKIEEDSRIGTLTNKINESEDKLKNELHLRSGNKKSKEVLSVKELDAKPTRGEEYEVFEVAADKSPFKLISKVETNNKPRYVPIYDYASENAYFRPYDKFGPKGVEHEKLKHYNIVEEKDENEFDTKFFSRNRFSGYNNDGGSQFRVKYNYPIQTENSKFYGFMKPIQTHFVSNINPYDYFDMDYTNGNNGRFILRSVHESDKLFPRSYESDHPFNSMHKSDSVKDHVRAVRQLLYLQKRFGYIPEVDKELRKSDGNIKKLKPIKTNNKKLFEDSQEKISLDYYYDRADDDRKDSENEELRENSSKIILVPAQNESAEYFNKVLNTINEKYLSETNSVENLNKLIQTEVDEKGFSLFFNALVEVLKDMTRLHDESLESYDWLRSSVDIQTAIWKLLDLTENLKHGEDIHPKDLELLKYCLYLFKSSKTSLRKYGRENRVNVKKRERKTLLPKNRKNKGIKHPLVLWKDFAKYIRNINYAKNEQNLGLLNDFEDFLKNVQINLNDLHDAIKHIAVVTKFDQQNWFSDLKEIYLKKASKKKLGVVLLHLSVLILVNNLEEEAALVSKVNFRLFVEDNWEKVKATRRKFVFVLRVLDELNRINL